MNYNVDHYSACNGQLVESIFKMRYNRNRV